MKVRRLQVRAAIPVLPLLLSLLPLPTHAAAPSPPTPDLYGAYPERETLLLGSARSHAGVGDWRMAQVDAAGADGSTLSRPGFATAKWQPALVPGTVLNSLVANGVYPEPYYGLNNAHNEHHIPDISEKGAGFYTYWFRTEFAVPAAYRGKRVWLELDGVNYKAEIFVNGKSVGTLAGMFQRGVFDVTDTVTPGGKNALAVLVHPIDPPNQFKAKGNVKPVAPGENRNGADGTIGRYTTMLMTAGWDFTFPDGIRDRNTGLWRNVKLFATGPVTLRHPFVKTVLPLPETSSARETITVEATNATDKPQTGVLTATVAQAGITLRKQVTLQSHETRIVTLAPEEFAALVVKKPRLWWPFNKGDQYLYGLTLEFRQNSAVSDHLQTRFGIRDIRSDRNTPDRSRIFYVNGKRLFIHGSNWVPEAMCRETPERTWAQLRYTRQSGVNFLRLWAGGVTESDQFYDLCDQLGILVWTEFWQTGDTSLPTDTELYRANVADTVKRLRNHASLAYYVSANERNIRTIIPIKDILDNLDPTRGWQPGSETDGIHDGSPYVSINPMWYYEDSASPRGSRINGFCPEYGCPILPTLDTLREIMAPKDLWPINKTVWDYMDGGGFHRMTTDYKKAVEQYGPSDGIEDYAWKSQMFGALSYRAIWECWNANRFEYGDRFSTGLLFWYQNSPNPQVCSRMWDWSLEPTAALYFSQTAHQPLHAQFDFLKNTVGINNEYPRAFPNCRLTARLFNEDLTEVYKKTITLDIPADRFIKNALPVELPANLSPVHFLRLDLADAQGKSISQNFYWRSNRPYTPGRTWTGPEYEGFADINKLPAVSLAVTAKETTRDSRPVTLVTLSNRPKMPLAFMVRLRLQDAHTSKPIRPAFYEDNYISLLPGESRTIAIEYDGAIAPRQTKLIVDGWNVTPMEYHAGTWKTLPPPVHKIPESIVSKTALWKVTASSSEEGKEASNAIDGDRTTRWASARSDNQWLMVDLGAPQAVSKVVLSWEQAYATEFKIQVSDDGQTWRDAAHVIDGKGGEEAVTFAPVTARYVRFLGLKRATEYGYSLWEIGVSASKE